MTDEPLPDHRSKEQRAADAQYAHDAANRPVLKLGTKKEHQDQQRIMQETGPYLSLGVQMAVTIGVFFAVGYWLDKHFHSTPLWTAILSAIGAVAGLTYFIITVQRLSKKTETK